MPKKLTKYQQQVIKAENRVKNLLDAAREQSEPLIYHAYGSDWHVPRETIFFSLEQASWFVDYSLLPWSLRNRPKCGVGKISLSESGITNSTAYLASKSTGVARIEIEYDDVIGGFRQSTLLHEAAHIFTPSAGHAANFQRTLTELYSEFLNPSIGAILEIELNIHKNA